jgi:hypothetical protein
MRQDLLFPILIKALRVSLYELSFLEHQFPTSRAHPVCFKPTQYLLTLTHHKLKQLGILFSLMVVLILYKLLQGPPFVGDIGLGYKRALGVLFVLYLLLKLLPFGFIFLPTVEQALGGLDEVYLLFGVILLIWMVGEGGDLAVVLNALEVLKVEGSGVGFAGSKHALVEDLLPLILGTLSFGVRGLSFLGARFLFLSFYRLILLFRLFPTFLALDRYGISFSCG